MPKIAFNSGNNEASDRADLGNGELQQSTGLFYKPGDPMRVHTINGRSSFGDTGSAAAVKGVSLLQFDTGGTADRLVALSGTVLYSALPGKTGTFSSLKTGLDSSTTMLSSAHYNDRWYLADGYDKVQVVESDGTVRNAGMVAPTNFSAAAGSGTGNAIRPGATGGTNNANMVDADLDTYGHISLTAPGSSSVTLSGTNWTGAGASRQLNIKWALAGLPIYDANQPSVNDFDDSGGTTQAGFNVTIKFEIDEDGDADYDTTLLNFTTTQFQQTGTFQYPTSSDPDDISVKITLTYNSGDSQAVLRIYDVRLQEGSDTASISTDTGLYYGLAEFDAARGLYSNAITTKIVTLSSENQVTLTLPSAAQNTTATHWAIYRTNDGGTPPADLGRIALIDIGQTSYIDDFADFDKDTVARPLLPLLAITPGQATGSANYYPQNTPPPSLVRVRVFQGHLVGLSLDFPRAMFYSMAGNPESWPEIYYIDSFPLEEHDQLMDCIDLGSILVMGANGAVMRVTGLPRVVNGQFDPGGVVESIPGAPGVVGRQAMTRFNVSGEPFCAWVSHYGIYVTNGDTFAKVSDPSIDWTALESYSKTNWMLHWDPYYHTLIFSYSSTGASTNDKYYLLHMHPEHRKEGGLPRVTGPHYGKLNALTAGQVGGRRRLYSAHVSDGKVYLEDDGNTDASNAYDSSGTLPTVWTIGRLYGDDSEWAVLDGKLHHTDFGAPYTVSVAWTAGRDSSDYSETKTKTVSLSGHKYTQFDISMAGDWHEATLTYTGKGRGAFRHIDLRARALSDSGKVSAA